MKAVILCADDFGMSDSIDNSIVTLLENQKISAVSCMTNQSRWEKDGPSLIPFLTRAKIGLHFNLPYRSLPVFIIKSYLGLLNKERTRDALHDQYEKFIKIIGRKPDFIDGHQHIHQLPMIRNIVIEFYKKQYQENEGFIRNTCNKQKHCFKARVINWLGGTTLKKALEKNHIPHNKNFSGIYDLSEKKDYRLLLKQFLDEVEGDGLIMCHPGSSGPSRSELSRVNEFNSLMERES